MILREKEERGKRKIICMVEFVPHQFSHDLFFFLFFFITLLRDGRNKTTLRECERECEKKRENGRKKEREKERDIRNVI